jgi:hypothetical protein
MSEQLLTGSNVACTDLHDTIVAYQESDGGVTHFRNTETVQLVGSLQDASGNVYTFSASIEAGYATQGVSGSQSGVGLNPADTYTVTITKS